MSSYGEEIHRNEPPRSGGTAASSTAPASVSPSLGYALLTHEALEQTWGGVQSLSPLVRVLEGMQIDCIAVSKVAVSPFYLPLLQTSSLFALQSTALGSGARVVASIARRLLHSRVAFEEGAPLERTPI